MAENLDELCEEITKKAHKIKMEIEGKKQVMYFVTPDDEIYQKLSKLKIEKVQELVRRSGISLSLIDIKNNLLTQYSEKGVAGDRYTSLPIEQRARIEKSLGIKKIPDKYD